jgi:hypothetical protein
MWEVQKWVQDFGPFSGELCGFGAVLRGSACQSAAIWLNPQSSLRCL